LLILVSIFAAAVLIQIIYLIVFLVALGKNRPSKSEGREPVSVIVCAHDEEQNLRELVPALLRQNHVPFEVVVVNDRSNDDTYDYLLELTNREPRVKMVNVKNVPERVNAKKYAITLGIRAAAHDIVLLTDADCRPASDEWISNMSAAFNADTNFVLGFSPYLPQPGFLNAFVRFESFVTALQYLSFALLRRPYMGVGRNMAYRKSLFLEKKGFNNFLHVLGGDDDLFVNQHAKGRSTRVELSAGSTVNSIPETTVKGFFYQKIRHLSVGKRYKASDKFLVGFFKASWILTFLVGLPLCLLYPYFYAIIAAMIIRLVLLVFSVRKLVITAGLGFNYWWIPVLDFVYPIYYISTGLVTLFTKKVRWKK